MRSTRTPSLQLVLKVARLESLWGIPPKFKHLLRHHEQKDMISEKRYDPCFFWAPELPRQRYDAMTSFTCFILCTRSFFRKRTQGNFYLPCLPRFWKSLNKFHGRVLEIQYFETNCKSGHKNIE